MLMKFIKRYAAVIIISFGLIEETHSRHPKDEESSQQTVEQVGNGLKLCAWRHCRFYSLHYFNYHYKGLFARDSKCSARSDEGGPSAVIEVEHKVQSATEQRGNIRSLTYCSANDMSDGDQCCETIQCYHCMKWATAIDGREYFVIHLPGNYQFCKIGECWDVGEVDTCENCVELQSVCRLLVFDPRCPFCSFFSFKSFMFPSHCACHTN